jgi:hypothetical protein
MTLDDTHDTHDTDDTIKAKDKHNNQTKQTTNKQQHKQQQPSKTSNRQPSKTINSNHTTNSRQPRKANNSNPVKHTTATKHNKRLLQPTQTNNSNQAKQTKRKTNNSNQQTTGNQAKQTKGKTNISSQATGQPSETNNRQPTKKNKQQATKQNKQQQPGKTSKAAQKSKQQQPSKTNNRNQTQQTTANPNKQQQPSTAKKRQKQTTGSQSKTTTGKHPSKANKMKKKMCVAVGNSCLGKTSPVHFAQVFNLNTRTRNNGNNSQKLTAEQIQTSKTIFFSCEFEMRIEPKKHNSTVGGCGIRNTADSQIISRDRAPRQQKPKCYDQRYEFFLQFHLQHCRIFPNWDWSFLLQSRPFRPNFQFKPADSQQWKQLAKLTAEQIHTSETIFFRLCEMRIDQKNIIRQLRVCGIRNPKSCRAIAHLINC